MGNKYYSTTTITKFMAVKDLLFVVGSLLGLAFSLKLGGWLGRGGAGRLGLMEGF